MSKKIKVQYKPEDVLGIECKHAIYIEDQTGSRNDMLFIKEAIHLKDKTVLPNKRRIFNFKRDFYVTKEGSRKHPFKKQFANLTEVQRYETTQSNLTRAVAQALRTNWVPDLRILSRSPYLYGSDITSAAIMKHKYREKWPELMSPNSVAVCDLESDVVFGHERILSGSLTYKNHVALYVTKEFLGTMVNPEEKIRASFKKYLSEVNLGKKGKEKVYRLIEARKIELEIHIVDEDVDVVLGLIQKAHEWQPDFLAFWNMAYDIPKMISTLERAGYDVAEVFSDPDVPPEYRYAKWRPGPSMKVTASGRTMSLSIAERWNIMTTPATFYCMDAMCLYQKIRIAGGKEPSYALDAILDKHLGARKLKFDEAKDYTGIGWHQFMQRNHKPEYLVYNIFDCISVELLDENNLDMALKISLLCGISEYDKFPSQPRRTCNDLHFFALENGKVIGSTSDKMGDDLDKYVVSTDGWIVTLPSHMIIDNGICCIEEIPDLRTKIRLHVADIDVAAAYPNTEDFLNISAETTYREVSKIENMSDWERRVIGINLTAGPVNSVEYCRLVHKLPDFQVIGKAFEEDRVMAVSR